MKKIYLSKLCAFILIFSMLFSLLSLNVMAENISLDPGVSEFSYTVRFDDIKDAYASAQFDVVIDDKTTLDIRYDANGVVEGIVFTTGLNGIVSEGRMDGNRATYKIGFTSPDGENAYSGSSTICTIYFRYTGTQPQKISIGNLEILRFTGVDENGIPQYSRESVNWKKDINVSQRTQTPEEPGNTTPGGSGDTSSGNTTPDAGSNPPAAGSPGDDAQTTEIEDEEPPQSAVTFTDLDGFEWAKESIDRISRLGIIKGDGKGYFMPGQMITRADFVLMLYRMTGFEAEKKAAFEDLPELQEYRDAIENAAGCGIIKGIGGNRFDPYGKITRQDAAAIVYRLLNYLGKAEPASESVKAFNDSEMISDYALEAMNFMINEEILQGSSGYLRPRSPITRAEAAVFLDRVIEKFELL
jgi:hypothetical protein